MEWKVAGRFGGDPVPDLLWPDHRPHQASRETYAEINKFQDALQAVPLSQWGKPQTPGKRKVDPNVNIKAPTCGPIAEAGRRRSS